MTLAFLALAAALALVALAIASAYLEARVLRWEHKALAAAEEQHWANAAAAGLEAERVRRERQALATDVPAPEPAPVRWSPAPTQPRSVGDERAETAHSGPVERPQSPAEPDPVLGDPRAVSRALSGFREVGLYTDPSCPCRVCRAAAARSGRASRLDYGSHTEKRWT